MRAEAVALALLLAFVVAVFVGWTITRMGGW